jgi:tRNA dimethylallyltransferase
MINFRRKRHHHNLIADQAPYVLFICGPTASGKTSLSLEISKHIPSEIINADIGQFYTSLSIGTAKPKWQDIETPHHLFDIIDEPKDINVNYYRTLVLEKVQAIWEKNKLPILVGGSLFYIKTLFYPLIELPKCAFCERVLNEDDSWELLNKIDPARASVIHHNDSYRIQRALAIWRETGKKPSGYKPQLRQSFHSRIIFISWPRDKLFERINQRTEEMLSQGWIEEVRRLKGWKTFLQKKRLIGYPEIFEWIERGEKLCEKAALEAVIQKNTRNYAKRQVTFWKKFRNILESHSPSESKILIAQLLCKLEEVVINKEINSVCEAIIKNIKDDLGAL